MSSIYCYCLADSFDFKSLAPYLKAHYDSPQKFDAVWSISIANEDPEAEEKRIEVFIFKYGCVIAWGGEETEIKKLIKRFEKFAIDPIKNHELDCFEYKLISKQSSSIISTKDIVLIGSKRVLMDKLAISHAFSQSVKLAVFETSIQKTIQNTKPLTEQLIANGKIALSRQELSRNMGALFAERHAINMHSDILYEPEFFWKEPAYQKLYIEATHYLDLQRRVDTLYKRSQAVQDLYNMLSIEVNHNHSSFLEWVIIVLIATEIFIALAAHYL